MSVIPAILARELQLPPLGEMLVHGATGRAIRVLVYRAELEVGGIRLSVPVAGVGRETLLGRDVINRWTLVLRGPEETLEVGTAGRGT